MRLALQQFPAAVVTLYGDKGKIGPEKPAALKGRALSWCMEPGSTKYVWIEVRTPQGQQLALTNPIWL